LRTHLQRHLPRRLRRGDLLGAVRPHRPGRPRQRRAGAAFGEERGPVSAQATPPAGAPTAPAVPRPPAAPARPPTPVAPAPSRRRRRRRGRGAAARLWDASPLTHVALVIAAVLSVFPIIWSFLMATRTNEAVYRVPPPLLPGDQLADNVRRVLE